MWVGECKHGTKKVLQYTKTMTFLAKRLKSQHKFKKMFFPWKKNDQHKLIGFVDQCVF